MLLKADFFHKLKIIIIDLTALVHKQKKDITPINKTILNNIKKTIFVSNTF